MTSKGAAGTPVSTGTSTAGSGVSECHHRVPGDRRCDSQVGKESLQGTVAHLPHLSICDESPGPIGALSWGKFSCALALP